MTSLNRVFIVLIFMLVLIANTGLAQWLLVPMDQVQTNHLKAYGLTYWTLETPREYKREVASELSRRFISPFPIRLMYELKQRIWE